MCMKTPFEPNVIMYYLLLIVSISKVRKYLRNMNIHANIFISIFQCNENQFVAFWASSLTSLLAHGRTNEIN